MKISFLPCLALIFLIAPSAPAQAAKESAQTTDTTIIFNIEILDFNPDLARELESLARERARIERLIADGKLRPLAALQVRTRSGETASIRSGQRIPVQTATSPQSPHQTQYENTGLNIEITPGLLSDDRIAVSLKIELSMVLKSASALNPAFIQWSFNDRVRVKPNETAMLISLAQRGPSSASDQRNDSGNFVVLLTARAPD
jgi:type II secretory pathway component GspD/PulD (secretin)